MNAAQWKSETKVLLFFAKEENWDLGVCANLLIARAPFPAPGFLRAIPIFLPLYASVPHTL